MKSTLNESEKPEAKPEFPKMYKRTETTLVVMFVSERRGFVVHEDEIYRVGNDSNNWIPCNTGHWEEYNGTVTLEN